MSQLVVLLLEEYLGNNHKTLNAANVQKRNRNTAAKCNRKWVSVQQGSFI